MRSKIDLEGRKGEWKAISMTFDPPRFECSENAPPWSEIYLPDSGVIAEPWVL